MSLNKKVLAAAIVGALMVGGTAAAAPLNVIHQYYADEIVIPADGFVPTAGEEAAASELTWASGYNYSAGEVKYVRVELHGATWTGSVTPTVDGGNVGAINGINTNILTFSVTSGADPIVAADEFVLPLDGVINIATKGTISVTVSLYDQASQAQDGGPTGRLSIGSYDTTPFLSFVRSYELSQESNTLVADVASEGEGVVPYGFFVEGATVGTLNDDISIDLVDPDGEDGPQAAPYGIDGNEITFADLFVGDETEWVVQGDFSAATAVTLGGTNPETTAVDGVFPNRLVWTGLPSAADEDLVYTVDGTTAIPASNFSFTFNPEAQDGYEVTPLTAAVVGTIRRNGVELQAPLAQVPPAWTSRLVLTNTGRNSPAYHITVLTEGNNTPVVANTSGVVNPGTNVIDLKSVMTGFADMQRRRGTIVVTVETPDEAGSGTIQGLYQIVNTGTGSISNHVMVRPGTN